MAKLQKHDRIFLIISIINLIIIGSLLFISYRYYNKSNKLNSDIKELNTTLKSNNNKLSELEESKKTKEEEITKVSNIESDLDNLKKEVNKLTVELENKILNGESDKKIAYLTFDDGPYYLTHSFLQVLKEKKVKGTFFTIGLNKAKCYDNSSQDCSIVYKEIYDAGHTLGNHTYSHLIFNGLYSSSDEFMNQVKKQEELIKEKTGYTTNIMRFPGGSASAGKLKSSIVTKLRENGYGYVEWTASIGDGGSLKTKEQAWYNFKNSINSNIEVVLMHDYNKITYSLLPEFIDYLQNNGYMILPLCYESTVVNK